jgi:2-keto-4-pentenoate hydratase/2-oxohepta-3-ene-1,7-dioic acid hydratase in catechol pathway
MRLVRFGSPGLEMPGVVGPDGRVRDLSRHLPELAPLALGKNSIDRLRKIPIDELPIVSADMRLGPCVADVGKVVCIGLNYSDHAAESGMAVPPEPVVFLKASTAISGPYDDVVLPPGSEKSDWEVELGVVIGTRASYVSERDAMAYVAGYCIVNDVSERAFQFDRGGQWVKGKSCNTFGPIGPWLVTSDEIADPQALKMTLDLNGKRRQDGSTANMVFKVPFLVSYVSQFMTLAPGDIISTGTPAGVGLGQKPPVFLREGDVMELEIEGLGRQRQRVVAYKR